MRRELLAELQRVLAEHSALLHHSASDLQEQERQDGGSGSRIHDASGPGARIHDAGVATQQSLLIDSLLARAKHNIERILRLPSHSLEAQVVDELSWRLLMPAAGAIWASWPAFAMYAHAVVRRWAIELASPVRLVPQHHTAHTSLDSPTAFTVPLP